MNTTAMGYIGMYQECLESMRSLYRAFFSHASRWVEHVSIDNTGDQSGKRSCFLL